MLTAHEVLKSLQFEPIELDKGYANRTLRIDLGTNDISIRPVTQQMKDLWVGGKGFDLWLMFQEINKNTKWDSPENAICFSPGPLAGTCSFPGSGKTLVTAVSPLTNIIVDCNVGGYFGPFFKFAGFDALCIVGKAPSEAILVIDAVKNNITIEKAPLESVDSHLLAEELTEMYADDELDKKNVAVVSAGTAADHAWMGILNFSFWDWRRNCIRLKQAGRGGIGTVFRDKNMKAIVIKNRGITPAWRIAENKVAKFVTPKTIARQANVKDINEIKEIIEKRKARPEYLMEILVDIQARFNHVSKTAMDLLTKYTGVSLAKLYHIVTFYPAFSLEPKRETIVPAAADGFIPSTTLDLKYNFDPLQETCTIMGSGDIRVLDKRKCIIDTVRNSVRTLSADSCGKCTPCREGLYAASAILARICSGNGRAEDISSLGEIAETMARTSLCQFGKTSANPVLSSLRHFKAEYEQHVHDKKCVPGICFDSRKSGPAGAQ